MAERSPVVDRFVLTLSNAITARGLYPTGHPAVRSSLAALIGFLDQRVSEARDRGMELSDLTLLLVDGDLVVNGALRKTGSLHERTVERTLEELGVERLTITGEAEPAEIEALVEALSGQREAVESSPHVLLGWIAGAGDSRADAWARGRTELDETLVEAVFDSLGRIGSDPVEAFRSLDAGTWRLLGASRNERRRHLLLPKLARPIAGAWRHAVSVCLHAATLARALGIGAAPLHDLSLGALLHDYGRIAFPTQPLTLHPVSGAAALAAIPAVPGGTLVVVYEHHLRYDGKGGYPEVGRTPGLAAQICAVADVWDVLFATSGRLAGDGLTRAQQARIAEAGLKRRSGKQLNPELVETFLEVVNADPPAA